MIPHPVPFFSQGAPAAGPAFVQAVFSSSILITSELPVDDTTPLSTEGAEILALTLTPLSAASRFLVHVDVFGSAKHTQNFNASNILTAEAATRAWAAALFRGSTCIQAACGADTEDNEGAPLGVRMLLLDQPATTAPVTWSVRAGPGRYVQSGTPSDGGIGLRINGQYWHDSGSSFGETLFNHRLFGGAAKCTLIVQELP